MHYNYKHPEWKEEDYKFIKTVIEDKEFFQKMQTKYAFNIEFRESIRVILYNLEIKVEEFIEKYKELYNETYK